MSDDAALLATLQLADSAFPSGAYALSHGLESLVADGLVRDATALGRCLRAALLGRLGSADLATLLVAHRAASSEPPDVAAIVGVDRRLAATKLAAEDRIGSARVGRRIAVEADRLAPSPSIGRLIALIDAGETPGTMPVAFGVAAAALGVAGRQAALAAASSFATGFLAAAVRLGRIGHGDAQRLLRDARPTIVEAVEIASAAAIAWNGGAFRPFAPELDIAVARHETAAGRLFAS